MEYRVFLFLLFCEISSALDLFGSPLHRASPGSNVLFSCTLSVPDSVDLDSLVTVWFFHGNEILRYNKKVVSSHPRITFREDLARYGNVSISLSNVSFADEGIYTCLVIYNMEYGDVTSQLEIQVPPVVKIRSKVDHGKKEHTLHCMASGFYPPEIYIVWMEDGNILENSVTSKILKNEDQTYNFSSSITVKQTSKHQDRLFTCKVQHASLQKPHQENFYLEYKEESFTNVPAIVLPIIGVLILGSAIAIMINCIMKKKKKKKKGIIEEIEDIERSKMIGCDTGEEIILNSWDSGIQSLDSEDKPLLYLTERESKISLQKNSEGNLSALISNKGNTKSFQEFLLTLGLDRYTTLKLSHRGQLHLASDPWKTFETGRLKDVPWYVLGKLLALNSTARSIKPKDKERCYNDDDDDEVTVDKLFGETDESNSAHALDVICALLHCSDHLLQREIITKMSICQFAIPVLLPAGDRSKCTFLLGALRDIVKRWKPQNISKSEGLMENCLVYISLPIFSFVRFQKCNLSKSQILNQILSPEGQYHDFFIHQDMNSGNVKRKISDGLVEMSWYFPSGSNSDIFLQPIAIANLRGDLQCNKNQFDFLTKMSTSVFTFVDNSDVSQKCFKDIDISKENYFFIINVHSEVTKGSFSHFLERLSHLKNNNYLFTTYKNKMGRKIFAYLLELFPNIMTNRRILILDANRCHNIQIAKKMKSFIREQITTNQNQNTLEQLSIVASETGFNIDENLEECKNPRQLAQEITTCIHNVASYKKETMRLQAELWKQSAIIEKELCKLSTEDIMSEKEYKAQQNRLLLDLLKKQSQDTLPDGMNTFLYALLHLPTTEIQHFLQFLRSYLDQVSRCNISKSQIKLLQDRNVGSSRSEWNLGVEHFLREFGLFYEAQSRACNETNRQLSKLPGVTADLLLDGFPLELIDGDSSNIPMQWITDVLTELDNKTGGIGSLKVISVLGVQSTGKSTLLNIMFGFQFPAGHTRNVRGAFMSFFKVPKDFQKEIGCQFVLVIDTDGLRAPELPSGEDIVHGNELATLAVGLSDITIVHMSTDKILDMKDILQTVVHAFLRMNKERRRPNCLFVHQNVGDLSAHDQNVRNELLLEQLDEMTRVAAKMENNTYVTKFSDIIEYDIEQDIWYIPGLWHGTSPMSSVNNGYSEKVSELKEHLLNTVKQRKYSNCNDFKTFIKCVKHLWETVKYEKFLFKFKPNIRVTGYDDLLKTYSKLEWCFREEIYKWMSERENTVKDQIVLVQEGKMWDLLKKEADLFLREQTEMMQKSLRKFFEREVPYSTFIQKHKEEFLGKVEEIQNELRLYFHNKCMELSCYQAARWRHLNDQNSEKKDFEKCLGNPQNTPVESDEKYKQVTSHMTLHELTRESREILSISRLMEEEIKKMFSSNVDKQPQQFGQPS